jgi:hypothetical protein
MIVNHEHLLFTVFVVQATTMKFGALDVRTNLN